MAIKTISQFEPATPTANDKILFEQNGEGRSTTLASLPVPASVQDKLDAADTKVNQLKSDLDTKVKYTDSLTYEEIMASTPPIDLDVGIPKASALKEIGGRIICGIGTFPVPESTGLQSVDVSFGVTLPNLPKVILISWYDDYVGIDDIIDSLHVNRSYVSTAEFRADARRKSTSGVWKFCWIAIY